MEMEMDEALKVVLHCSWVITFFGITSNSLSLYFFINKAKKRSAQRNTETSATQLFVFLNSFDTVLCLTNFLMALTALELGPNHDSQRFSFTIFFFAEGMTYFITCLLSVRRLINLVRPLYLVKTVSLNISIAVFSVIELTLGIMFYIFPDPETFLILERVESGIRIILVVTIVFSSVLSFWKLHQSFADDCHARTRYATVTVGILSAIFCICNIGPLIGLLVAAFHPKGVYAISPVLTDGLTYILIPLNSACNPVVYITRRSDMRNFFVTEWKGVKEKCGCGSGEVEEIAPGKNNNKTESTTGQGSRIC